MIINVGGKIWEYVDDAYCLEFGRVKISVSALDGENWYVSCPIIRLNSEWVNKGQFPDLKGALNLVRQRLNELKNDFDNIL